MKKYLITASAVLIIAFVAILIRNNEPSFSVYDFYDLNNLTPEEMVASLDRQTLNPNLIGASVSARELFISHADGQDVMPLENDMFYLSFAPYIEQTHPCFNHNLVTCRGELANESVYLFIETDEGTVLYDEIVTLYDNGFKGIWLPHGIEATMTVAYEGLSVTVPLTIDEETGTCLTEALKLS